MNTIILKRNNYLNPEFPELFNMIRELERFLDEPVDPTNETWLANLEAIIRFQDEDGSFKLLDSYRVESDARVDFCHVPNYLCTAILMKAFLTARNLIAGLGRTGLHSALRTCCHREFRGHGYEAFDGQLQALAIFMKGGVREFLSCYEELCPEFTEMFRKIAAELRDPGHLNDSYAERVAEIDHYFSHRNVFVYGTLMAGERNHHFLSESKPEGRAILHGYDKIDLGSYPGAVPGEGSVEGELYEVDLDTLHRLDLLEGEGDLYLRKCAPVVTEDGQTVFALFYEYRRPQP